jgi:hypothetical protein
MGLGRCTSNMPRQNRVTPFSTLIATSARGTLTGNRGCLHDDRERIQRQFRGKRWIICLLDFKGRKRSIMTPGHYTELFFLDEATALAAGHRPCAECQRERFNLFRELWAKANPEIADTSRPAATTLDAILHQERITTSSQAHWFCNSIENLPDGAFITDDEKTAYLVLRNQLLRWSAAGYEHPPVRTIPYPARVLTPASVLRTLAAGYPVGIHSSAFQGIAQSQR